MRVKVNIQPEFDFQPSNLKVTNEYYRKYEEISKILEENPKILNLVHKDLKEPLKYVAVRDREGSTFKYTSDTVLRILVCQIVEGASLREIIIRTDDSNYLRRFVRIYNGPMVDFTTLDKLKNSISSETWKKVNKLLARHAVEGDLIGGERLRLDTTAVETNIHWPTDSALLWDTYRVLARRIEQARRIDPHVVGDRRLLKKKVKRLYTKISRKASQKPGSTEVLKPLYEQLISLVEGICDWSASVADTLIEGVKQQHYGYLEQAAATVIVEELVHYVQLGNRVMDQAHRRVLDGEQVPNDQKLFSIFEPHTELLKRGKAGKDIEFGHMIQIQQVREKFITDYAVFENKPNEPALLEPAIENHKKLFGAYPAELGTDKGYYDKKVLERVSEKVSLVSIAKKGTRTAQEIERETDPAFRHVQRFRAGVEGTISFLKRILGLFRCYNKGWAHYVCTVGATVFVHNLLILAKC